MAMPTSGLAKEVGVTFLNEGIDCCHDENNCLFAPSPSPSTIFVGKMRFEEKQHLCPIASCTQQWAWTTSASQPCEAHLCTYAEPLSLEAAAQINMTSPQAQPPHLRLPARTCQSLSVLIDWHRRVAIVLSLVLLVVFLDYKKHILSPISSVKF